MRLWELEFSASGGKMRWFYHMISVQFEFRSDGLIRSYLLSLVRPITFYLLLYHGSPFFHRPSFPPRGVFWQWFTEGSPFYSHVGASLRFLAYIDPVGALDRVGVLKGQSASPVHVRKHVPQPPALCTQCI